MKRTPGKLSPRELEVVEHLAQALPTPVIAKRLQIREATVRTHVQTILRKMAMTSRLQVVVWAYKSKLVHP